LGSRRGRRSRIDWPVLEHRLRILAFLRGRLIH
jgi:hypothetical protein